VRNEKAGEPSAAGRPTHARMQWNHACGALLSLSLLQFFFPFVLYKFSKNKKKKRHASAL
jgi:hypothetical protein